jgi:hypothetical protein
VSSKRRLRNVTVTLQEEIAAQGGSPTQAAERVANFGKRHGLSLRGLKMKDLINEGRQGEHSEGRQKQHR